MLSTPPTIIVPKLGAGIARLAGYENLMGKGLCEVRFGRPLISEGCERVPRAREIKAGFRSFRRRPDRSPSLPPQRRERSAPATARRRGGVISIWVSR
jgi:hypothetical protein